MHEKKQGKFMEGFFWGGVVGGGLSYLLSTQKGRDFLKDLIQTGMDALENATVPEPEIFEEEELSEDEEPLREEVSIPASIHASAPMPEQKPATQTNNGEKVVKKSRFFRKSPKK